MLWDLDSRFRGNDREKGNVKGTNKKGTVPIFAKCMLRQKMGQSPFGGTALLCSPLQLLKL
jgi:hypothetical protein